MFGLFPESGTREALIVAACTTAGSAVISFVRLTQPNRAGRSQA
jgi:hypothetical protein